MATTNNTGSNYAAVTPSDTTIVGALALFVGTGGNVSVKANASATAVVFKNVPSGAILPISAWIVMATGTTATDIVAIF